MPDTAAPAQPIGGFVHTDQRHESAHKHVAGTAAYADDIPEPKGMLHAYAVPSPHAHAKILSVDLSAVREAPGVALVLTADDVPGVNDYGPVKQDDPIFPTGVVEYVGQCVYAIIAVNREAALAAAKLAKITYEPLPAILDIDAALAAGDMDLEPPQRMHRGDAEAAIAAAERSLSGSFRMGGQEHFYLEGQIALAVPGEDRGVKLYSSTQNPTEVQHLVARTLAVPDALVEVEVRRMGGGFGGKETQPAMLAAIAALAADRTGKAVKFRMDRDDDMIMTGKRHDFRIDYRVGFDGDGRIEGIRLDLASRCGRSMDLSAAINDRAMFHCDNTYFLPHVDIRSRRLKTHTVSNTAFRGFGGPQGMVGIERVMDAIAADLKKDPLDVRVANLYGDADSGRTLTPYGMTVEDNIAPALIAQLRASSDYDARRAAIRAFNAKSRVIKRGIALTPVKFGISFTTTFLNQAGALVHVYTDGSVYLNHGGTEMGQGLYVKIAQIVADVFGIPLDLVKVSATSTAKVPNTSATAASSGTDLNGMAARQAASRIKERLIQFAAEQYDSAPEHVSFSGGDVFVENKRIPWQDLVKQAYLNRVSLSSTGFYKTPKIHYDRASHSGRPFFYFCYGAAVSEVEIDGLTGENRVTRVDILHDVGKSLNPVIDRGQIEGGFIQGMGWLMMEELVWTDQGKLATHAPSTYKIPACSDYPDIFTVALFDGENREATIHRSKAVGEPPFMLAISAFAALNDAVASVADYEKLPALDAPATPERVLMAVDALQAQR